MNENNFEIKACKLTGLNLKTTLATRKALGFDDMYLFIEYCGEDSLTDFFRGSKVVIDDKDCDIIVRMLNEVAEIEKWFKKLLEIRKNEMQEFKTEILDDRGLNIFERLATDFPKQTIALQVAIGLDWKYANELYVKFFRQYLDSIKESDKEAYNKGKIELDKFVEALSNG